MSAVRTAAAVGGYVWRHPANRGHRLVALNRAARYQLRGRLLGRPTITPLGHRSRIRVRLHEQAGSRAVYGNPPDYAEFHAWERLLQPGDLFVDGGANVGIYSLWAAELGAHVIALEPAPSAADALRWNSDLNDYQIDVRPIALAERTQTLRFTSHHDAMNHISAEGDLEVAADTLDRILAGRQAAVKLDLEGTELAALQGAAKSLAEHRVKVMQVEWCQPLHGWPTTDRAAASTLLEAHGYRFYRPDAAGRLRPTDPTLLGSDVFVLPAESDGQAIG